MVVVKVTRVFVLPSLSRFVQEVRVEPVGELKRNTVAAVGEPRQGEAMNDVSQFGLQ